MEERSIEVLRELLDCSWFVAGPALTLQRLSRLLQERHQLLTTP